MHSRPACLTLLLVSIRQGTMEFVISGISNSWLGNVSKANMTKLITSSRILAFLWSAAGKSISTTICGLQTIIKSFISLNSSILICTFESMHIFNKLCTVWSVCCFMACGALCNRMSWHSSMLRTTWKTIKYSITSHKHLLCKKRH